MVEIPTFLLAAAAAAPASTSTCLKQRQGFRLDPRQDVGLNPVLCWMEKAMLEQPAAGCSSFLDNRKTEMAFYTRARAENAISALRCMSHVVLLTRR